MAAEEPGPVFPAAPPERIELSGDRALVRWSADRAEAAVRSINESLEHLAPWMAWAAEPATDTSMAVFLAAGEELWDQRRDFGFSIIEGPDERIIGAAGLHGRQDAHALDIGYWVHVDRIAQGVATEASRALTDAAFAIEGIERVRIQCDQRNARSARVPEKLGYRLIGLSEPTKEHLDREATMDWVIERADWMTMRQEAAS